jgi:hypothetical protein
MNQVLYTCNADLAKRGLDDLVVSQRDSGSVDFAISSLVDQLGDVLLSQVSVDNVWLYSSQHVGCRLVELDEDSIVELSQSE